MDLVELRKIMNTRHEGNYYKERQIIQILTKSPQTPDTIDPETIKSGIQPEYQGHKSMKTQAESLRTEHRTNLAEKIEDSGKGPYANHVQNMKGW